MDIKPYRPEEHGEYLPDVHRPYYRAPEEVDRFAAVVEEAFEELEEVVEFDEDIEVVVAETDETEISEDSPDAYYFHGFSLDDGMRGYDGNAVIVRVSDRFDWWQDAFKDMIVHETGHQLFYQRENKDNWEESQYFSMMFEGYAENLADAVGRRFGYGYSPPWRKQEALSVNKTHLYEDLEKPRSFGDEEDDISYDMFLGGGERWKDAGGYTIAYQIVRNLLDRNEVQLETFINTDTEEWKRLVENAVERLY